jgi:predicted HAD superfamily Cof-like phosphohydrolase
VTPLPEFFDAYGIERPQDPQPRDTATVERCQNLIEEEFKEVVRELRKLVLHSQIGSPMEERLGTLGLLLKELADLRYVVEYAAVAHGLDIEGAYAEVHRSNMSKLGEDGQPIVRADGKILKGPNFEPADMSQFVHIHESEPIDEEFHA